MTRPAQWWRAARPHIAAALPAWATARLVVLATLAAANIIGRHLRPIPGHVAAHLDEGLLGWDAVRYHQIAEHGYAELPIKEIRFFPLLPLLARWVGALLGGREDVALLLLANVPALVLGALVHRLVLQEKGDARTAQRAVWLVAMAPPAFVFVWGYSEGIAMSLAAWAFLALRRRAWWWAALAGVLSGLTRPVGLLLTVPALVEAARGLRGGASRPPLRDLAGRLASIAGPAVGCAVYLAWVWHRFGDPFLPFDIQESEAFRGPTVNPLPVIARAIGGMVTGPWRGNVLHLPWVVVVAVLVVLACRRWPASYSAWAAVTFVAAISANHWGSFERYAFGAFPITLTAACVITGRHGERAALVVTTTAMAGYGTMALLGAYVP